MRLKRKIKQTFAQAGKGIKDPTKRSRRFVRRFESLANKAMDRVTVHVEERARTVIQHQANRVVEQVQSTVQDRIKKEAPRAMRFSIGVVLGAISALAFSIFLIQVLIELARFPAWLAFLTIASVLAIVSFILIQHGRHRSFPGN